MKLSKFTYPLVLGLALTLMATGCKKKPYGVTPIPGRTGPAPGELNQAPAIAPDNGGVNSSPSGMTPLGNTDFTGWKEDTQTFAAQTVHFDFDSAVVRSSDKPKIAVVASYLKANPSQAVRVEGNCDERGTEEYNRSLGERRALAVREVLINMGVSPDRVATISYGEDRPVDPGHNEAAWAKNRRDDFVLLSPP
ncbi:MAG TPA: peptidoglycan-associated lipoprotein Pal [Verrucomicrobiae bacterium]|nr:peptidoglycan-associated lipoprotein Pal [Verrucomicrobiae bacterium]